jgi:hypothetical protein
MNNAPLSIRELAIELKLPGDLRTATRRLRRLLLARERSLGRKFMHRLGSSSRYVLRVTLAAVRRHCPELLARVGEAVPEGEVERLKKEVDDLRLEVRTLRENDRAIGASVARLSRRVG